MVFYAIRFLLSRQIRNMLKILINFQQKFALVRSFQQFAIKFLNLKWFLAHLKKCFKIIVKLAKKLWRFFLLESHFAIDRSNLASENDVNQLSELQIHVQK